MEAKTNIPKAGAAGRKWIQILHVAKRECALDDDSYRTLLFGAAGVQSASEIKTQAQYNAALTAFKKLGFTVRAGKAAAGLKKTAPQKGRSNEWISKKNATKVILALRDIAEKAGYNPDRPSLLTSEGSE